MMIHDSWLIAFLDLWLWLHFSAAAASGAESFLEAESSWWFESFPDWCWGFVRSDSNPHWTRSCLDTFWRNFAATALGLPPLNLQIYKPSLFSIIHSFPPLRTLLGKQILIYKDRDKINFATEYTYLKQIILTQKLLWKHDRMLLSTHWYEYSKSRFGRRLWWLSVHIYWINWYQPNLK